MDLGSFTKAARALGQPKSRVSRRLAALEAELGVQLLYRTSRQLSLTEAGRGLYEKSRAHVEGLEEAARGLVDDAREPQGLLKLTAMPDIGSTLFGPVIAELAAQYPRIVVDLQLSEGIVDLVKDGLDLALRVGKLKDTSLKKRPLGHVAFILVASPTYLRRAPRIERLGDLSVHPALVFASISAQDRWRFRDGTQVSVRPLYRSNEPKTLLELAIAGRGVALLPEFLCLDALRSGTIVRVLDGVSTRPLPIQFVWPGQRTTSPKVKAFVDLAVVRLKPYFA